MSHLVYESLILWLEGAPVQVAITRAAGGGGLGATMATVTLEDSLAGMTAIRGDSAQSATPGI